MADQFNTLDLNCCEVPASVNRITLIGRNDDVDSGTDEDVWPVGGDYPFSAVDAACELLSDNAADTAAGTGAQKVVVTRLSGGILTQETVTPNGVTPVALINQYNRIFQTEISQAGSSFQNVGNITIQQTTGPVILGRILPGQGDVLNGIFTIPDNWNASRITSLAGSLGKQAASFLSFTFQYKPPGGGWNTVAIVDLNTQGSGVFTFQPTGETSSFVAFAGYDFRARTLGAGTVNNGITVAFGFSEI